MDDTSTCDNCNSTRLFSRSSTKQPEFYDSDRVDQENRIDGLSGGEDVGGDHKYFDNYWNSPHHAVATVPEWYYLSYYARSPGLRLYTTGGLLDANWHKRTYWAYGRVVGSQLVFNGREAFAALPYPSAWREGGIASGSGYPVYAGDARLREDVPEMQAMRPPARKWTTVLPLRPIAMAIAGNALVCAGPPDFGDPIAAQEAIEGLRGGSLRLLDTENGELRTKLDLHAPPVHDGLAIAHNRIIMSLKDGSIICYGATR